MTLALVLSLVVALAGMGFWLYRRGGDKAKLDTLDKVTEAQRAQLDAAMRSPVGKDELVDRLRKDGL